MADAGPDPPMRPITRELLDLIAETPPGTVMGSVIYTFRMHLAVTHELMESVDLPPAAAAVRPMTRVDFPRRVRPNPEDRTDAD